jgi:hypothetical protein
MLWAGVVVALMTGLFVRVTRGDLARRREGAPVEAKVPVEAIAEGP